MSMEKQDARVKLTRWIQAFFFFLLTTVMYYFNAESITLWSIDILYKMLSAAAIMAGGFAVFLVDTDLVKAKAIVKYVYLLLLPHLAALLISMPLWVINMSKMTTIRRGLFEQLYGIFVVLAVAALIYIFEKNGIWLNLASMLTANLMTIFRVILESGIQAYWKELKAIVISFAKETGELMKAVEIHELTFALGFYLFFLTVHFRKVCKTKSALCFFLLTVFCFLSGMKRIGVFALCICVLADWALAVLIWKKDERKAWLWIFSGAAVLAAFAYICFVRSGIYVYLEERFQLDTMGRRYLNSMINRYYEISPSYLGQGGGFISRLFSDMPEEATIRALHNDVLKVYIDLGFWGFGIWMLVFCPVRVYFVTKWQGIQGGILCACYCLFLLITAFTDNTIYYPYVTAAMAVLIMGYHFHDCSERDAYA